MPGFVQVLDAKTVLYPEYRGNGVLEEAKQRGLIPAARSILDELIAAGIFISENLYRAFLRAMGEEQS